ncbi:MAG: hypothetical protein VX617_02175 [Pseudomonadota bacterium]|nr:hypothetical protein [Pseudomonadota bacterium]
MKQIDSLISEIEEFCHTNDVAESTFGRLAVNDGKFVARLRAGKGVTIRTVEKVRNFIFHHIDKQSGREKRINNLGSYKLHKNKHIQPKNSPELGNIANKQDSSGTFRFYDNRQKYLMFVNTCSEKWAVADRVGQELSHITPNPPALRIFDAGMGDGTVLTSVMRNMHLRFSTLPFYIVGKEISLEDVRLTLEKMPDRFFEHPATVLVVTNLYYTEAPKLMPLQQKVQKKLTWTEVALEGNTSYEFHEQINNLEGILAKNWEVKPSKVTGNPLYVRPSVLVLYRSDHKFILDQVLPTRGQSFSDYDLIIASQPYRARMPVEFKVQKVIAPLADALAPGGRLVGIHSYGNDPGLEIIRGVWSRENPFITNRHDIMRELKREIGKNTKELNFNVFSDNRSLFRYEMHTLPEEVSVKSIGTSTLLAAWNAAIYVAQIEDQRLEEVIQDGSYLEVTREVLHKHSGLWFNDESYVISRRRRK